MTTDGFTSPPVFFTGVVEDVLDPKQMGRVRVRCFGFHTADKTQIPTEALPWALVSMPVTSAAMSGLGQSPTGILPGSWVWGFFRDGPSCQDPFVCGSIPSTTQGGDRTKGFSDPSGTHPINPGQIDNPIEARSEFQQSGAYQTRIDLRQEKIETAVPPKLESVSIPEPDSYYTRKTWDGPDIKSLVQPVYPNNLVTRSLSGHVTESDDTPAYSRQLSQHRSGTYEETYDSGDRSVTVVGDNYVVILKSNSIYVKGSSTITIDGDFRQLVKGNYHLEVEGNKTEYVKGSRQSKIGNSEQIEIGQDRAVNISGDNKLRIGSDSTLIIDGDSSSTIAGNKDETVAGDSGLIVGGDRQEYSDGVLEVSAGGHLVLASAEEMKIETKTNFNLAADGNQVVTIAGSQTNTVSGSSTDNITGAKSLTAASTTTSTSGNQSFTPGGNVSVNAGGTVSIVSSGNTATPPFP